MESIQRTYNRLGITGSKFNILSSVKGKFEFPSSMGFGAIMSFVANNISIEKIQCLAPWTTQMHHHYNQNYGR
jgi:hypothetical protein